MISNPSTQKAGRPNFPKAIYRLRITQQPELCESKKAADAKSLSTGKYLKFNMECVGYYDAANKQILTEIGGVEIAGWEFDYNCVFLKDGRNISLTQLHQAVLDAELPEITSETPLDPKTLIPEGVDYTDMELYAECESQMEERKDELTGKPQINPLTGQPVCSYWRKVNRLITP